MPVAHINLLRGHDRAALQKVIAGVTEAMAEILKSPKERFMVWITEVDPELWGVAGAPASEALRSAPRASIETPFVQMVLMKGRSTAQYQAVMDAASDVIARELGLDKARVRVHLAQAEPDFWAIGGTPYAVLRADEMAARERATA